jgi:hypothetical protein
MFSFEQIEAAREQLGKDFRLLHSLYCSGLDTKAKEEEYKKILQDSFRLKDLLNIPPVN